MTDNYKLTVDEEVLWDEYKQGLLGYDELFDTFTGKYTEKGEIINKVKWKLMSKYQAYKYKEIDDPETGEKRLIRSGIKPTKVAKLIQNEFSYFFLTLRHTKEIYFFNNKYFQNNGETIISQTSQDFIMDFSKINYKNEIISDIRDYNYVERIIFKTEPKYINLQNGVLDIETGELHDHAPDYYFLNVLPVEYDPSRECNNFIEFLQHICMQQNKRRKVIEDTIQEYMGYSLYGDYPYKRYAVFDGSGDNAKTTLFNIIMAIVGKNNNTSVTLQELNKRPFAKSQLYGKLTNICDDLPKEGLKYTGVIKQITGNSPIWADVKNHKKGIYFTNIAKPWYACNELPETDDITDAFFSRQLQITLLNKYVTNSDEIDNHTIFKADPEILKKITEKKELSGILNFALEGLKRLRKKEYFTLEKDQTTEIKRETWLKKTNPVYAFLEDEIESTDPDNVITVDDFTKEILDYCDGYGFDRPTRHKITGKMHDAGMKKQQRTIKGEQRVWCWIGIKHITNLEINHYLGTRKDGVII